MCSGSCKICKVLKPGSLLAARVTWHQEVLEEVPPAVVLHTFHQRLVPYSRAAKRDALYRRLRSVWKLLQQP